MSRRRKGRLAEASRSDTAPRSLRPLDAARRQWGVVVNMNSAPRLARSLLMLAAVAACVTAPASPSDVPYEAPGQGAADQGEFAAMRPEGRLRKLHLVRPDLIPYPIAYEVYC